MSRQPIAWSILVAFTLLFATSAKAESPRPLVLNADTALYTSAKPGDPLYRAVRALQRDLKKVVGVSAAIKPLSDINTSGIVIRGPADGLPSGTLTGPESHHLYVETIDGRRQLILEGADVRGEIYAIYTFSERVLGVPPFWYYSAWVPGLPRDVTIPATFDVAVPSPQVRYRAWFPNDTDLFAPWRKLSADNSEMWLEAALRLKLNTIEWFDDARDYGRPVQRVADHTADQRLRADLHHPPSQPAQRVVRGVAGLLEAGAARHAAVARPWRTRLRWRSSGDTTWTASSATRSTRSGSSASAAWATTRSGTRSRTRRPP